MFNQIKLFSLTHAMRTVCKNCVPFSSFLLGRGWLFLNVGFEGGNIDYKSWSAEFIQEFVRLNMNFLECKWNKNEAFRWSLSLSLSLSIPVFSFIPGCSGWEQKVIFSFLRLTSWSGWLNWCWSGNVSDHSIAISFNNKTTQLKTNVGTKKTIV